MKDDECGRSKYKGENMSEWSGIFRFEGEDKGERVWIVLYLQKAMLLFFYSTLAFIQTTGTVVAMLLQYLVSVLW
jgi:hypothetical protein